MRSTKGLAAVQIGGRTIHSFSGIELGGFPRKKLLELAWRRKKDWRDTQVLIIDEVPPSAICLLPRPYR